MRARERACVSERKRVLARESVCERVCVSGLRVCVGQRECVNGRESVCL